MSKQREQDKPPAKPAKDPSAKPEQSDTPRKKRDDDDPYDQGDIATPRRDPPYEDGI